MLLLFALITACWGIKMLNLLTCLSNAHVEYIIMLCLTDKNSGAKYEAGTNDSKFCYFCVSKQVMS